MPHPFVLLMACIAVAAILSYVIPSGEFERRQDAATGRTVVVPGSYHAVPPSPLGPFQALIAVPKGMVDAGSVIFLIFLAGGAFSVIDATGAFKGAVHWLSERFRNQTLAIIPIVSLLFATGGIVEGMWEEIVALVPVLMLLARRVGFDALTVVAMSLGAAGVGSTFSPFNPFNVGIAQRLAELPLLSGMWFRIAVLVPALGLWVWATMRHASRTRVPPEDHAEQAATHLEIRHVLTLIALAVMFAIYVFGTLQYSWGFDELSALFLLMGVLVGLVGGLGVSGRRTHSWRASDRWCTPQYWLAWRARSSWCSNRVALLTRSSRQWSHRWRSCRPAFSPWGCRSSRRRSRCRCQAVPGAQC